MDKITHPFDHTVPKDGHIIAAFSRVMIPPDDGIVFHHEHSKWVLPAMMPTFRCNIDSGEDVAFVKGNEVTAYICRNEAAIR